MRQIYYTIRTLLRERGSNIIRIISLSLGLTIGILLFSQIAFELSYEQCYPEAERLALVRCQRINLSTGETAGDDKETSYDYTVFDVLASTLAEEMPKEVEVASSVLSIWSANIYYEDKLLPDADYIFADTCFFQTFGIPVLQGNPKDMIMPGSVFVSEHFARETFGDEDPVGKVLSAEKQNTLTIRGIYKDVPENTMLTHDFVISVHQNGGYHSGAGWRGNDVFYAFLRLRHASDIDKVNADIQRVIGKYTDLEYDGWKVEFSAIPLVKLHLVSPDVQKRLVIYGFLGFAIFFVAIMNYMLISIATLSRRAKGVGVHKCNGASSTHIFRMFMAETGILVILSVLLSFLLIINARDLIEDLLSVRLSSLFTWETLWVPLLTILVLFILVLGLLLVTLLQYSHLMSRDMGIVVPGLAQAQTWLPKESVEHIKDDLNRQPMVEGVTVAVNGVLGEYWTRGLMGNDGKRIATLNYNSCHYNYPEVMGIEIIEGTTLKKQNDLLVNEELVRLMKWTDGAVGKTVNDIQGTIVGVFRDIRNKSFYVSQSPIVLIGDENANHAFDVRLKEPYNENLKRLNEFVENTYPNISLRFILVDQMVKNIYKDVYRFRNSVWITSAFILLIVIMGLIGYVNDETQRRSKEIAIRKVNGAEASHILGLLTRDILYVSVISILVGTTVSYFAGQAWLDQFAEQIDLNPLLFAATALFVQLLIVICVVLKAWHIANENPVNSIKAE